MKTILITGGSGMVGTALTALLKEKNYHVIWLSRERYLKGKTPRYHWDYRNHEIDEEAIEKANIIVHLAGKNISDNIWTNSVKQRIEESRVKTAQLLFDIVKKQNKKLDAFISASAIGYYGQENTKKILTEDDTPEKDDFMARTCQKWESEAHRFSEKLGVRTVILRTGVVFSQDSEALKKMAMPVRYGVGSPIASGKQYVSWVHIDDLCQMYFKAIEDASMHGVYNTVAPDYITNAGLMRTIARIYKRPFFLPNVPAFVMRLFFGEMAEMIIHGSRISSQKIKEAGFVFKFPELKPALKDCLLKKEKK